MGKMKIQPLTKTNIMAYTPPQRRMIITRADINYDQIIFNCQ